VLIACFYLTWFIVIITFTAIFLTDVKGFLASNHERGDDLLRSGVGGWGFLTPRSRTGSAGDPP